ncbi:branched-chain amino acid aminotransferase [Echinicola strongylocentroti]|uniref:branched-chain-amino-acid transaminase n=1 Tax=Echinicola strongylocentroti TaxID=1795355 RepID=A0A2Z4IGX3_9BACT|nr:aminotransferase class IV [Echinicola strongylocentroti]AWW29816.1 branched-chain amino acid aminotransferase [Echinicola strongylocentroti]
MKPFCYAIDKIITSDKASLHPIDIGLIRGYAVFDFFRTVNYHPLFLDDYLDRFIKSAAKAHLTLKVGNDELKDIIMELIHKNELKQGGIRMVLSGGISDNHFSPSEGSLFIFCEELMMPSDEKYSKGVHLLTTEYIRPIPEIKTTNYALPVFLSADWKANGAEDVLYHANGIISESSRSNIFIVKNGTISTPKSNILHGITRKNIVALVPDLQIRDVTLQEVMEADEVFMSSTTKRILPITKIDHQNISNGQVGTHTKKLIEAFEKMEKEKAL